MYDPKSIGAKIARGGDRTVYRYGASKVIKISSLSFFLGGKLHTKLMHDYEVCKRYLPQFVVHTEDATPPGSKTYVEIQDYIEGEMLMKKHFINPTVREQFKELLADIKKMQEAGYPPLDLIGNRGVVTPRLSNILVDKQGNLKIIDAALLESTSVGFLGFFLHMLIPLIKVRQNYLIKKFLA